MKDEAAILQARARALARRSSAAPGAESVLELLEFSVAPERYAVENRYVREVCAFKDLTPLPCTPRFVLGIVNVRGRIFPVLDLKKFFDLPEKGVTDLHRIILVGNGDVEFGLLADMMVGARTLPASALQPALPTLTGIREEYLKGVTAERLVVLDLPRIFADRKIIVHEEVE